MAGERNHNQSLPSPQSLSSPQSLPSEPSPGQPSPGQGPSHTRAQRDIVERLGAQRGARPEFAEDLSKQLHADISEALAPLAGLFEPEEPLFVNKHRLAQVHGCEARFLHDEEKEFAWSVPIAIGTVAHKAIELSIHWRGEVLALDLVDEALGRLSNDALSISSWLKPLPEVERAQLRGEACDRVAAFLECWPHLAPRWRPVTESRVRSEFLGGRVVCAGKVDLTLGRPEGQRAGKVLIDFKTGRFRPQHHDDLRFYSLLETLRIGTPPRMVASYYLDQGSLVEEAVTIDTLEAAAHRLVQGAELIVELTRDHRTPAYRPGPSCRWCPLLDECTTGQAHLAGIDEGEDIEDAWMG